MSLLREKINYPVVNGFTTSEVVVSVALLSVFYASILTISSIISSSTRSSEIRPALDQVVTSDIELIRNNSWAYLYYNNPKTGESCYLTDPSCTPSKNKSLDEMRTMCSNLNYKFLRNFTLPKIDLTAASHSVFRDNNSALSIERKVAYNTPLPIPLRSYELNTIRLEYYLRSTNPQILDQLSDISKIHNNQLLLRTYTFSPAAHSFCTGSSVF